MRNLQATVEGILPVMAVKDQKPSLSLIILPLQIEMQILPALQKPISWKKKISSIGLFALGIELIFLVVIGFVMAIIC